MTTVASIIQQAYRESNLIAVGVAPTQAEQDEGLVVLQRMLEGLYGHVFGDLLRDWEAPPSPASADPSRYPLMPEYGASLLDQGDATVWRNPPPNVRVILSSDTGGGTIYMPPTPADGARIALVNVSANLVSNPVTISGNGRKIENSTSITLTSSPATPILWFYRADQANWVRMSPLAAASESPLPPEMDNFLIARLSVMLSARTGTQPSETTIAVMRDGESLAKSRYWQSTPGATFPGAWRMRTSQSYGRLLGGRAYW